MVDLIIKFLYRFQNPFLRFHFGILQNQCQKGNYEKTTIKKAIR